MKLPNGMVINLNKHVEVYHIDIGKGNVWVISVGKRYMGVGDDHGWVISGYWNSVFSTE